MLLKIFTAVWNGASLSATHKNTIIQTSQKMVSKRATVATDFTSYYMAIANANNELQINASEMSTFLEVTQKTVEKLAIKDIRNYLKKMKGFMYNRAVHHNVYSRVYVNGAFQMVFLDEPDEALQNEFASEAAADIAPEQKTPTIKGPIIRFDNTNVILSTSFDSTGIKATKGVFSHP